MCPRSPSATLCSLSLSLSLSAVGCSTRRITTFSHAGRTRVGTCAAGLPARPAGEPAVDLLWAEEPLDRALGVQLYWERFPSGAEGDVTTYMFAYCDAVPERPTLTAMLAAYFRRLPAYAGVTAAEELEHVTLRRALFGFFPCHRDAPLVARVPRLLHIADAGGNKSAVSFGGFGAMLRATLPAGRCRPRPPGRCCALGPRVGL